VYVKRASAAPRLRPLFLLSAITMGAAAASLALAFTSNGYRSSAGCEGLRAHLAAYFERASLVWDPDPWSYPADDISWKAERMPLLPADLIFYPPSPRHIFSSWESEAQECTLTVGSRFYVDGDTIAFTLGREPEFCSEAPRMMWTDLAHKKHRQVVPPLFNWNVEALWCTENYLIFGLTANYEYGGHDECLAFWNVDNGHVVLSPGAAWDDSGRAVFHEGSLLRRLPGWREAPVAEVSGALVFTRRDTVLVFWPEQHAYAADVRAGHSPSR